MNLLAYSVRSCETDRGSLGGRLAKHNGLLSPVGAAYADKYSRNLLIYMA